VKPDNLLIVNEDESHAIVKIGDFNVSEFLSAIQGQGDDRPVSASVGSPAFMAPELLFLRSSLSSSTTSLDSAPRRSSIGDGDSVGGYATNSEDETGSAGGSGTNLLMYSAALSNPKAADVWALGVSLFNFIFAKAPFSGPSVPEVYGQIQHAPLQLPWEVSASLTNLLEGVLDKDPSKRMTIEEIKEHQWCREEIEKLAQAQQLSSPQE